MKSALVALGIVGLIGLMLISWYFGVSNKEIRLRNMITAKQADNLSSFDNMTKKICQSAKVTQGQTAAVKAILSAYVEGRGSSGGTLFKSVTEAVPNIDQSTWNNLLNIINASRDAWTMRQKEILDMSREHNNLLTTFPSSIVCGGRPAIKVIIVTSTRADEAFKSGKDDDVDLFGSDKVE